MISREQRTHSRPRDPRCPVAAGDQSFQREGRVLMKLLRFVSQSVTWSGLARRLGQEKLRLLDRLSFPVHILGASVLPPEEGEYFSSNCSLK
jgi:hypothetical protein